MGEAISSNGLKELLRRERCLEPRDGVISEGELSSASLKGLKGEENEGCRDQGGSILSIFTLCIHSDLSHHIFGNEKFLTFLIFLN